MPSFTRLLKHTLRPWWYRAQMLAQHRAIRQRVGENTYIDPTVQVLRWRNVQVGAHTIIAQHTTINVNDHRSDHLQVRIGNHCFIGQRNFFSPGHCITVGDFSMSALDTKFLGASHLYDDPMVCYQRSGTELRHDIRVGVNCWLASAVTVMGTVTIGHGSVVGAHSIVRGDIPPFCLAVGQPARVIKRYSFLRKRWVPTDAWSEEELQVQPSESAYLHHLLSTVDSQAMAWRAAGKSMGDSW